METKIKCTECERIFEPEKDHMKTHPLSGYTTITCSGCDNVQIITMKDINPTNQESCIEENRQTD